MIYLIHTKVASFSRFSEILFVSVRNTSIQGSDNWLKLFLEKRMPKLMDEPCSLQGIEPKEHHTRPAGGFSGQRVYPFKAMVLGDFFRLHTAADALKTRNALKTFYRASQNAGRRFTVRPSGSDWFCRRVA